MDDGVDNDHRSRNGAREPNGHYAALNFEAVYDALAREVKRIDSALQREIGRINDLRQADQISLVAALTAAKTAVDAALAAAEKAVAAALIAAKEAVNKAELAQQRTNEGQDQFRAQLKEQAATLLPRTEYAISHAAMTEKLDGLQRQANDLRSRLDIGPPSLGVLQARSDNAQGRSAGQTQMIGLFLTIGALAIAVIGLVLRAMWGN